MKGKINSVNPILIEVPDSFETERLTIRGVRPGDGASIREAVLESQDDLMQWMDWAVTIDSGQDQEVHAREAQLRFLARENLLFMMLLKGSDTMVGNVSLHDIEWSVPSFEIGYWVRKSYTGQGFITEAVNGVTRLAFESLSAERVEIMCDSLNERSAAVARRAGYSLEAIHRADERHHLTGELRDTLRFVMLRPEYGERNGK